MDSEADRDLRLLAAIATDAEVTQRRLAAKLGISLGLTNLYLKRLARKGSIKLLKVQSNRVRYLITPKGIAEKARLTYESMAYSLQRYRDVRRYLKAVLGPLAAAGVKRIAIYGTGETAELVYLSLRELGLEPAAIFDGRGAGEFLGMPVQGIRVEAMALCDRVILATLERPETLVAELMGQGLPREKLLTLR